MKFAAIIPPVGEGLRILERVGLGYHLCLAQELLRNKTYREYYRILGRLGHFIIVDNGAAEHDTPPFAEVAKAARYVGASEVVMPDTIRNAQATIDGLRDGAILNLVPARHRFIVPQGQTIEEWKHCLLTIHRDLDGQYATIGLSKYSHDAFGGRAKMIEAIPSWIRARVNVHVLGIATADPHGELLDLTVAWPYLRGVDTGAPIAYAQRSRELPDAASTGEHISLSWDAPFDLVLARQNVLRFAQFTSKLSMGSWAK